MRDEDAKAGYVLGLCHAAAMAEAMAVGIGLMFSSETVPPEKRSLWALVELLRSKAAEAAADA